MSKWLTAFASEKKVCLLLFKVLSQQIPNTLFPKGLMFLWCVRDGWGDIYSERGLLLPISSSRSQRVPTCARLRFSALCLNLTAWFSSRCLLPVTHLCGSDCPIYKSQRDSGVTRNEPKFHDICYITVSSLTSCVKYAIYSNSNRVGKCNLFHR